MRCYLLVPAADGAFLTADEVLGRIVETFAVVAISSEIGAQAFEAEAAQFDADDPGEDEKAARAAGKKDWFFVGISDDHVDRGPDRPHVIDFVLSPREPIVIQLHPEEPDGMRVLEKLAGALGYQVQTLEVPDGA